MSDDDKTTKDEPEKDVAENTKAEPETTESGAEVEDKPEEATEVAAKEPKEETVSTANAPAPAAEPAGTDQQGRTLYNVKCTNCGKDTQVPFQPAAGRPVYCRDCYMQKKNS